MTDVRVCVCLPLFGRIITLVQVVGHKIAHKREMEGERRSSLGKKALMHALHLFLPPPPELRKCAVSQGKVREGSAEFS